jgi:hypothetical protein
LKPNLVKSRIAHRVEHAVEVIALVLDDAGVEAGTSRTKRLPFSS